ncbi:DUF6456 domain-containing protein [Gemmobacter tilapiae]|uniref:DUF6456 domain-containing protein n=2 Tax=Neogemmobacter tilapiae TaxID=875041 RepID=A0A918TFW2_9RHOB|nr:DUF6456 domain-containing protein [Gemmobacter tilapiae]GHC44315.1 hypothetical protein GCM10007315_01860 [Gemmobacter tilapiae]
MPNWLPNAARLYLDHTEQGLSLRALARREGCHASTVIRQVRRYESRRDDPLVDEALGLLGRHVGLSNGRGTGKMDRFEPPRDEAVLRQEAGRVLRHLLVEGTFLAISADMEKAAVIRQRAGEKPERLARVERATAQAFALKEWIVCEKPGRVATYVLTPTGRSLVRRFARALGFDCGEDEGPRRRDKDGKPFLEAGLVQLAERLHEDFELAQMGGAGPLAEWEAWVNGAAVPHAGSQGGLASRARERVAAALRVLGPGLGDVVLHCCCRLEGLEAAEQRLGWAARSGKIVLRIALQHLRRYDETLADRNGQWIG